MGDHIPKLLGKCSYYILVLEIGLLLYLNVHFQIWKGKKINNCYQFELNWIECEQTGDRLVRFSLFIPIFNVMHVKLQLFIIIIFLFIVSIRFTLCHLTKASSLIVIFVTIVTSFICYIAMVTQFARYIWKSVSNFMKFIYIHISCTCTHWLIFYTKEYKWMQTIQFYYKMKIFMAGRI